MSEQLFEIAKIGIEAERFLSSELGKYLLDRADADMAEAIKELKTADIRNERKMRRLQDQLNIPDKVVSWINEVISAGEAAYMQLKSEEEPNY